MEHCSSSQETRCRLGPSEWYGRDPWSVGIGSGHLQDHSPKWIEWSWKNLTPIFIQYRVRNSHLLQLLTDVLLINSGDRMLNRFMESNAVDARNNLRTRLQSVRAIRPLRHGPWQLRHWSWHWMRRRKLKIIPSKNGRAPRLRLTLSEGSAFFHCASVLINAAKSRITSEKGADGRLCLFCRNSGEVRLT